MPGQNLDLKLAIDAHIHKTLLKSKKWTESGLLPEEMKETVKKPEGDSEQILARNNVTSRLWATKAVKDAMDGALDSLYRAAELENPAGKDSKQAVKRHNETVEGAQDLKVDIQEEESVTVEDDGQEAQQIGDLEPAWDGFDDDSNDTSKVEDEGEESGDEDRSENENEDEDEDFSRYDGLIANSSDEDSFDEDTDELMSRTRTGAISTAPRTTQSAVSRNSMSVSLSPSPSTSPVPDAKPSKKAKVKAKAPAKVQQPPTSGSTFLPTLMGGYWSGSEEATDDETFDAAPPPRKNRMGQQARRALAEKKFGSGAKHIKEGKGKAISRDKDWDPKRGARPTGGTRDGRGRGRGREGGGGFERSTGENAVAVVPKARGMGKKDDAGPLHPSWEARKIAKATQNTAKFQGKKVVFD